MVCFFDTIDIRIKGDVMKFSEKSIKQTKNIIEKEETKEKFRLSEIDFTRNRKFTFKNVVYYNLNKKGLTSKMEIEEFTNLINVADVSNVAVLKQREKLNANIYNEIRNKNLETFYTEYQSEVKTFKGYLLLSIDGSYFEIPNTEITRKNYDSKKNNTAVPRALISNYFDVLNHYVVNTVIGKETADEKKLEEKGFEEIKKLNIPFPIIRIKDRGYVSLKDFYYSNKTNEKYVVRLKKQDYKKEIAKMTANDETIELKYDYYRMYHYKDIEPEFYKELTDTENSIYVRIVKIELSNGEIECLATNLTEEEVTLEDMNILYNLRWQIELNYHLLKESLKIETITSSKEELIKQDIYSQMLAFNILQSFITDAENELKEKQNKYKHEMKINKNMAVGFFKKALIFIMLENDFEKQSELLDIMVKKIKKYLVPVRKGRTYPRDKNKDKNKYSTTKRKAF